MFLMKHASSKYSILLQFSKLFYFSVLAVLRALSILDGLQNVLLLLPLAQLY
ncbi:hypothetical protein DOT_1852 [Desulfosporosinus sp. OT]|nr:hypothetical protein DOT_1852 [Desulfosporosinus sp. OT]